ncbi:MAG: ABC transporter permease [Candidatus Gracilibacteria bacterium]|nr:ABC transporter permease [Candidatus Gracilibacteria bacterium]
MNLSYSIQLAVNNLKRQKTRTILTLLGIIIGISTIIVILSAGGGLKKIILSQLGTWGSDTVFVEITVPDTSDVSAAIYRSSGFTVTTLKTDEMEALKDKYRFPEIKNVYALQFGQALISYGSEEVTGNIIQTNPSFIEIDSSEVEYGRFFTEDEERGLKKVIVIGNGIAEKLFPGEDPVSKSIKFDNLKWEIVGVLEERGAMMGVDMNKWSYVPLETYQKLVSGQDFVTNFVIQLENLESANQVKQQVTDYLREEHGIEDSKDDDFMVMTMDEAMEMVDTVLGGINLLLGAIAGISLLVGGIGIMNIMLVSVTERTPEIGLRKSIGATNNNILCQFMCEAIVVTLLGGILGIVIGTGLTWLMAIGANYAGFEWEFSISVQAILLGLAMAFSFGLTFGLYPAWKASKLDPIEAMRKE